MMTDDMIDRRDRLYVKEITHVWQKGKSTFRWAFAYKKKKLRSHEKKNK